MDIAKFEQDVRLACMTLLESRRNLQRYALEILFIETAKGTWASDIVPAYKLSPRSGNSVGRALARLDLATERTLPHKGFMLTELGAAVRRRLAGAGV